MDAKDHDSQNICACKKTIHLNPIITGRLVYVNVTNAGVL